MSDQYADPGDRPDALEEAQRARSQYTTSRATQTLGDYSYRNPQHQFEHQIGARSISFPYPDAGTSGGWGGAGGPGDVHPGGGDRDRSSVTWDERWDHPEHGEEGEGGTGETTSPTGYSPWGSPTHGANRDFNDAPVPSIQGASAGEPLSSGSPYL
jgi:hypothetical protein